MNDTNRLDGKIALVTGATGEIGTATVRLLAQRGAAVVALDLPGSDFTALAGDLGDAFAWTEADVSDEPSLAAAIASVISRHGHIDVLFNNAGVEGPVVPIVGHDLADFRKVMAVNVEGVFLAMKYVLPGMITRTWFVVDRIPCWNLSNQKLEFLTQTEFENTVVSLDPDKDWIFERKPLGATGKDAEGRWIGGTTTGQFEFSYQPYIRRRRR